ncbi:MAG: adenosylcobinamide-phosphate synthase CbiB [Oscillospiraceae bacterium]|nr:adenosylcobinamide-phosphate synthase CbiB [Oscillospiraceae bacterium]
MKLLFCRGAALLLGYFLEQTLGWPQKLCHPIMAIGFVISKSETLLRRVFPKTKTGERAAGLLMAAAVPLVSFAAAFLLLYVFYRLHWAAGLLLETLLCYSLFASGSLRNAARAVSDGLEQEGLPGARLAVSRIVGRDTEALSEEGVVKATVETVAENLSDGVVAPLLYTALLGAPGGFFYKAVNTMDSMVGYQNDRYRYFGTGAARLDDLCNLLPARLSALLMLLFARLCGLDGKGAWRIFRRDRYNHKSPNSAQTESVMAGALGVQLAGDAVYFGVPEHKKTIGDPLRPIGRTDIGKACRLMLAAGDAAAALSGLACMLLGG